MVEGKQKKYKIYLKVQLENVALLKDEHDGFVAHYVEVYIGLLTMRFFIGDDIHPIERESHSKLVSYYWKGRTVAELLVLLHKTGIKPQSQKHLCLV